MKMYDVDVRIIGRVPHDCPLAIWVDGWLIPCGPCLSDIKIMRESLYAGGLATVMLPTGEVATGRAVFEASGMIELRIKQTSTKRFVGVVRELLK